eukprot:2530784-Pleurochrysis_carterae.AAC.1
MCAAVRHPSVEGRVDEVAALVLRREHAREAKVASHRLRKVSEKMGKSTCGAPLETQIRSSTWTMHGHQHQQWGALLEAERRESTKSCLASFAAQDGFAERCFDAVGERLNSTTTLLNLRSGVAAYARSCMHEDARNEK